MIVRLLVALMALCLSSLPAAAGVGPCHEPGGMNTAHHMPRHTAPAPADDAMHPHVCIGCAPVADWLDARFAVPPVARSTPTAARIVTLDLGRAAPPALPPPRAA